jgi:hypothetical protein
MVLLGHCGLQSCANISAIHSPITLARYHEFQPWPNRRKIQLLDRSSVIRADLELIARKQSLSITQETIGRPAVTALCVSLARGMVTHRGKCGPLTVIVTGVAMCFRNRLVSCEAARSSNRTSASAGRLQSFWRQHCRAISVPTVGRA